MNDVLETCDNDEGSGTMSLTDPAPRQAAETRQHERKTDPTTSERADGSARVSHNVGIPHQQEQGGDVKRQDSRIQYLTAVDQRNKRESR
jgi:hypothetical protein